MVALTYRQAVRITGGWYNGSDGAFLRSTRDGRGKVRLNSGKTVEICLHFVVPMVGAAAVAPAVVPPPIVVVPAVVVPAVVVPPVVVPPVVVPAVVPVPVVVPPPVAATTAPPYGLFNTALPTPVPVLDEATLARLVASHGGVVRGPQLQAVATVPSPLPIGGLRLLLQGHRGDATYYAVRQCYGDTVLVLQCFHNGHQEPLIVSRSLCRPYDIEQHLYNNLKSRPGKLYVMNPYSGAAVDIRKIGRTEHDVATRRDQLRVASPFLECDYVQLVQGDHKVAEELTKRFGAQQRIRNSEPGNEWYTLDTTTAMRICARARHVADLAYWFKFGAA